MTSVVFPKPHLAAPAVEKWSPLHVPGGGGERGDTGPPPQTLSSIPLPRYRLLPSLRDQLPHSQTLRGRSGAARPRPARRSQLGGGAGDSWLPGRGDATLRAGRQRGGTTDGRLSPSGGQRRGQKARRRRRWGCLPARGLGEVGGAGRRPGGRVRSQGGTSIGMPCPGWGPPGAAPAGCAGMLRSPRGSPRPRRPLAWAVSVALFLERRDAAGFVSGRSPGPARRRAAPARSGTGYGSQSPSDARFQQFRRRAACRRGFVA